MYVAAGRVYNKLIPAYNIFVCSFLMYLI